MSTHGDDEHLFFAGLLPIYACEQDYDVQLCYFTDHREWTKERCHEMLNGLWAVGVRTYPHFGAFPDFRIDDKDSTYLQYELMGVSKEKMLSFCVEQIRRFRPQVVVGHDFAGEYGHGMHQVYAELVSEAVYLTHDPNYFPSSAERYGLWDVPKTYFHVYPENSVELELDAPLKSFAGMSAFDVSRYVGFPQHVSQQIYTTFTHWIYGPNLEVMNSKDITRFSPRYYGLFRTTVGPDVEKNDLMENTKTYNERKQAEADRLAAEEAARLEAERLEQERLAKEEADRIAAEEAAKQAEINKRLEEKRQKEEAEARRKEQQQLTIVLIALGILVLLSGGATLITRVVKTKKTSADPPADTPPSGAESTTESDES
jgi:LmbE family N-acetylglucosaminyl deacetylase